MRITPFLSVEVLIDRLVLIVPNSHLLLVKDVVEEVDVLTVTKFAYMMNKKAAVSPM